MPTTATPHTRAHPQTQPTRRQFLRDSTLLGTALLLSNKLLTAATATAPGAAAPSVNPQSAIRNPQSLQGFIVTDAHFGWDDPKQPAPAKQKRAIDAIRRRFPDLDVMLDTGDPHHNGAPDTARANWSDIIMYQDDPIPFYYIPGNHDIAHASTGDDEFRCATLGSHEARPYYSFDLKNIHFISFPQLTHTVLASRESLEWLRLDMELNKDKTTILLAHNSLIGYSKNYEEGYRGIVNTRQILNLMNAYPNCVAWMYGHNHNYEVVKKQNKLYISNGRIGGFDPSKGAHGIGGMYFEITAGKIDIRSYSAEFDKFVDEIDDSAPFRGTLQIPTSLDPAALPALSIGAGMACNGTKTPVYHHHTTAAPAKPAQLHIAGVAGTLINEDPNFTMFMARKTAATTDRQLMAGSVTGGRTASFEWKNPGVLMLPSDKKRVMTLPRTNHNKYTYYRVAAGHDYEVTLDLQDMSGGGQTIAIRAKLYDRQGQQVMAAPLAEHTLTGARQQITQPIKFPASKITKSIYTDETSDNVFNISVELEFSGTNKPVMLHRVAIGFAGATDQTQQPSITFGSEGQRPGLITAQPNGLGNGDNKNMQAEGLRQSPAKCAVDTALAPGEYRGFALKPRAGSRSVVSVEAAGNGMATWHYRLQDLQWQVLGAPVEDRPASLLIGPMRNHFSRRKEVALTPCSDYRAKTFLSRLRNIDLAEVSPLEKNNPQITVKILKVLPAAATAAAAKPEIEIYSPRADLKITGGQATRKATVSGHKYIVPVAEGATLTIA